MVTFFSLGDQIRNGIAFAQEASCRPLRHRRNLPQMNTHFPRRPIVRGMSDYLILKLKVGAEAHVVEPKALRDDVTAECGGLLRSKMEIRLRRHRC